MGVGAISSKTVVGILSVLFLAAAVGMWAMGGYVIATYRHISTIASAYYTLVPAAVMVVLGIVFLLGAISGFCAITRENKGCSLTFFLFIFLTFALLITAIILSFVYKKQINQVVEAESNKTMGNYGNVSSPTTRDIDWLQMNFHCCGSKSYESWTDTPFGHQKPNHVPVTCCKNQTGCFDGDLGKMNASGPITKYVYDIGCEYMVEKFLKDNLYYLGAGAIAFLVLLILGMVGSCYVLWQRKDASYFNLGS